MKSFFRSIHLYLSLAAGLVIMMSCVTGAILVFEHEIEYALHQDRYYVEPGATRLPLSQLVNSALKTNPEAKLAAVKVYLDETRTVEIGLMLPEKSGEGKNNAGRGEGKIEKAQAGKDKPAGEAKVGGAPGEKIGPGKKPGGGGKPGLLVYVNPYTGQIAEVFNRRESFLFQVEMFHRWFLGGKESIGKTITNLSTFFFLFILITGIILWWPKTKKILSQRLKIKWNGGWKRFNHDMHIVTGFYTAIFLIITVMTALVMAYNWVNEGIFTLTGSKMENPPPPTSTYQAGVPPLTLDAVFSQAQTRYQAVEFYNVRIPSDSTGIYAVNVLPEGAVETASDNYFIDQYSGKEIGSQKAQDKNTGQKIRSYVKPIHTGAIFGLPTKILSFIICVLTFTFPITGVIMWLNRLKGNRKKRNKKRVAQRA